MAACNAVHAGRMIQQLIMEVLAKKCAQKLLVDSSVAMAHVKGKYELMPKDRSYVLDVRMLREAVKDEEYPTDIQWTKARTTWQMISTKPQRWSNCACPEISGP